MLVFAVCSRFEAALLFWGINTHLSESFLYRTESVASTKTLFHSTVFPWPATVQAVGAHFHGDNLKG